MKAVNVFGVGLLLGAGLASAASLEDEGYPALFVSEPAAVEAAVEAEALPAVETAPVAADAPVTADPVTEEYMATFYDPAATDPAADGAAPAADVNADTPADTGASIAQEEPASTQVVVDPVAAEAAAKRREELRALRGPYIGIVGGSDHVDLVGIGDGTAAGLLVGYRITEMFAAEATLNRADYSTPVVTCLLDSLTTGLYGVARSGGARGDRPQESFYLKGRLGVLSESLSSRANCAGVPVDDVWASAGVGVGVRLGGAAIEFDYTLIEENIYRLGWSLQLNF